MSSRVRVDIEMERVTLRGAVDPRLDAMLRPEPELSTEDVSRTMRFLASVGWVSFFLLIFIGLVLLPGGSK